MTSRPIEIVGGGLAGLSLGLALQRRGVAVTLHEAGHYPRHRVCGEFITGLPARTRATLGLDPLLHDALPNQSVAWFRRDTLVRTDTLPEPAPSLSRFTLDARLAEAFVSAGGRLLTGTRVAPPSTVEGCVWTTGRRPARDGWLGLKLHATGLALTRDLELHLGDGGYVGLTRVESGRVNVCGLFRRRELSARSSPLLTAYLRATGLHALAARLEQATVDEASFSAVAAMAFDRRVKFGPTLALGDASATIPPFTGHGMAMAFQSAEVALEPLLAYAHGQLAWTTAQITIQRALGRRFWLRLGSARVLHAFLQQPARQRWLAWLSRARVLPLRPLYAALH